MLTEHDFQLTKDDLRIAITALGGPTAAARLLSCSDTLIHAWKTGRREISAEKAWLLHMRLKELTGTLPGIAYRFKLAAEKGEQRLSRWRASRSRWQSARGDKPRLSRLERSERGYRDREIARRVAAGEPIAKLAKEFRASPRTIERWARRGSRKRSTIAARG